MRNIKNPLVITILLVFAANCAWLLHDIRIRREKAEQEYAAVVAEQPHEATYTHIYGIDVQAQQVGKQSQHVGSPPPKTVLWNCNTGKCEVDTTAPFYPPAKPHIYSSKKYGRGTFVGRISAKMRDGNWVSLYSFSPEKGGEKECGYKYLRNDPTTHAWVYRSRRGNVSEKECWQLIQAASDVWYNSDQHSIFTAPVIEERRK